MELKAPPLFLDSCAMIVAFEHASDAQRRLRRLFWPREGSQIPAAMTSELTVAECMVKPFRDRNAELINLYDFWFGRAGGDVLQLVPIGRVVMEVSAIVRAKYNSLKLPDAIQIAAAVVHGAQLFLTGDKRLAGTYDLTYHWPEWTGMGSISPHPISTFDIGQSDWTEVESQLARMPS